MKKLLILAVLITLAVSLQADWTNLSAGNQELFRWEDSERSETKLEFKLDGYESESVFVGDVEFTKVSHPQAGDMLEIGLPDLPVFTTLVAISGSGTPQISYEILSTSQINGITVYPHEELQSESDPQDNLFSIDEVFYSGRGVFPESRVIMGEPAIMRDVRLVSVTICPFQYNAASNSLEIAEEIKLSVSMNNQPGINELAERETISKSFLPFYQEHIINYEQSDLREDFQQPCILFVCPNSSQVLNNLEYLTDWKHERGFEVHTATTSQTGSNNSSIKNYIQTAYNSWDNPPEYVVLVGDAGGSYNIPTWTDTWSGYNGEGDQPYSQLAGGDVLADVIVGRMAFGTITELQTMIAKSINYEKQPYMNSDEWFETITLVGDPSSSGPATISTCRYVQELTQAYNPEFNYNEIFSGNYSSQMSSALNSGTLYFCYRGYIGMSGFGTGDINSLSNGWMLPFATILTCGTGGFTGTCRSEVFARAGSSSNPKGAIAAVGTATSGTHTCFNNCVTAGMYEGIFNLDIFTPGGALVNGKYNLYLNYPQNPDNFVNIFSHWNNLMGDPSVSLYTGTPQEMNVEYPSVVGQGALHIPVNVTNAFGNGIENAWVTILKGDDDIFATGYTDESGEIWLPLPNTESGDVTVTVTAHDHRAFQDEFTIEAQNLQLNPRDYEIDDDNSGASSGNNNSVINNGETIELDILVNNSGNQSASNVSCQISTDNELVNIITDQVDYPSIPVGETIAPMSSFVVQFDPAICGGTEIVLDVTVNSGTMEFTGIIELVVEAPCLSFDDYTIQAGNGILDPGEEGEMTVSVENLGGTATGALDATLISTDPFIDIDDAQGSYGNIYPGGNANNSADQFTITLASTAIPGMLIPFEMELTNAEGFVQSVFFSLEVGTITVNDPVGPDAYGYLCYDEGDEDYLECPSYDWIEISTAQGGNGTMINISTGGDDADIEDVDFPAGFTFNFYGEHYTMFTVATSGWIAPGGTQIKSFMNWHLPEAHGPSPMIAAFWDDLHNGSGHVYTYYDPAMHYYIIEWDHFANEANNAEETFQIILYDANYYPTSTMDSQIKIQYKEFNNVNAGYYRADHGQYCTVGLEDPTGLIGLEYTYNNDYATAAQTLTDQSAIMFTTLPIPPDGPYLTIGSIVLDDQNGNGTADYGEEIDFDLNISNIGSEIAHNVSVSISSFDPWITLSNTESVYPDIIDGEMEANLSPFHLTVDDNVPDGHLAPLNVTINCNEGSWELISEIELNAPNLTFLDYFVNDGVDNILDPGETSDILVNFINNGGAPVYDAEITLSTTDAYLTINEDTAQPGDIAGEETVTGIYTFTAAINSPVGHQATILWELSAGQDYSANGTIPFVISQVPVLIDEDFSGNFPPDGWFVDGQNWGSGSSNNAGGSAPEAKFSWSPSVNGDQRLVCGPFSTSGSSELDLSFRQNVNHYSGNYSLLVETSSNGSNWHTAASYPAQNQGATVSNANITTTDVGSSTFYFAFTFSGNSYNINYWYIDNVMLEGVNTQPLGYIQGDVSIGGTGNVEDVSIEIGDEIVHPNSYGHYSVILEPGIYDLTASLAGYDDFVVENIQVIATEITVQNITLGFIPSPENLMAVVQEDGVYLSWDLSSQNVSRQTRDIEYYNIYSSFNGEDFDLEGNATEMNYLHQPYLPGDYEYRVTAYYSESGETLPSNTAMVWYEGEINFGDINTSYDVGAYDAALILQYFVGFDPLPQVDPRPWEEWRIYLGDVDANGNLEAYDASLILQYYVGYIDQFPCEPRLVIRRVRSEKIKTGNSTAQ